MKSTMEIILNTDESAESAFSVKNMWVLCSGYCLLDIMSRLSLELGLKPLAGSAI